jgi:hypothetical protein
MLMSKLFINTKLNSINSYNFDNSKLLKDYYSNLVNDKKLSEIQCTITNNDKKIIIEEPNMLSTKVVRWTGSLTRSKISRSIDKLSTLDKLSKLENKHKIKN